MLDPWIIEEIVRRERDDQRRRDEERRIELPLENPPRYHDSDPQPPVPKDEGERGVIVIDI
ncbi:MAG: hypothetical protein H6709_14115 [Kofleriaceae bacterium]|nr:hypothetical protein [Myxococcales bacterium]MCB9565478.1 hypothetical protein [Kofleriaceae bacterium]MCB9573216.1 hypothetical protein [Kofleriaceae bacterium]